MADRLHLGDESAFGPQRQSAGSGNGQTYLRIDQDSSLNFENFHFECLLDLNRQINS